MSMPPDPHAHPFGSRGDDELGDDADLDAIGDELETLGTEAVDQSLRTLDLLGTAELVASMHAGNRAAFDALGPALPAITHAVDAISTRMAGGGRLVYVGAGTSGRLGVLDASECPPTFGTDPSLVIGIIAGGERAIRSAVERSEDDPASGAADLVAVGLTAQDSVVGLSASGRTPYVLGALRAANDIGALTVSVAGNERSRTGAEAAIAIEAAVGAEFIAGSTRLNAGTAQKLVINMLSTLTMVRLGKTFGNVMVDLRATNAKLLARSRRTVATVTGVDTATAAAALQAADGSVKEAVFALLTGSTPVTAATALAAADGYLRIALDRATSSTGFAR